MLAAQELGRQKASGFKLLFPWEVLCGATNPARNHGQAGDWSDTDCDFSAG